MKIGLLLVFVSFISLAKAGLIEQFTYDGSSASKEVSLSGTKLNEWGQVVYYVRTAVNLSFMKNSRLIGEEEFFHVELNDLDIGIKTRGTNNILTLGRLDAVHRWANGYTWFVDMDVSIQFFENKDKVFSPFRATVADMMVDDDFLAFTVGKVYHPESFAPRIQVKRKRFLRSDIEKLNIVLKPGQMELTEFGEDRTLVTVDLAHFMNNFERGQKHEIKVELGFNQKSWVILTDGAKNEIKKRPSEKVTTTFQYSEN